MSRLAGRLLVLAALLGAVVLRGPGVGGTVADDAAAKGDLPADLARIPGKALLLVSLRPADLWESPLSQQIRGKLGKDQTHLTRAMQEGLGLAPAGIERLTLVLLQTPQGEPLLLVTATRMVDPRRTLGKLIRDGEEKEINGKKYLANQRKAAAMIGPRSYALGTVGDVQTLLESDRATDGMAAALPLVAGKHSLVVAINPQAIPAGAEDELPAEFEPYKPLLKARLATLTVDLAEQVQARLRLTFPGATEAAAGEKALTAARDLAINFLPNVAQELKKSEGTAPLVGLVGQLQKSLKSAGLKREGSAVATALAIKLPGESVVTATAAAVMKVREASQRAQSSNNLKQMGLAFHNYHDTHGAFPPQAVYDKDGKPLLSWRVLVLPYLDEDPLYRQFRLDEPWDSPHNKKLLAKMPRVLANPTGKWKEHHTGYRVLTGKGAAFEGKTGQRLTSFTDGTSNTLLAVETGDVVPWTKPDELACDPGKDLPKFGGVYQGGFLGLFADGSVRFISSTLNKDTLRALISRNGGEVIGGF